MLGDWNLPNKLSSDIDFPYSFINSPSLITCILPVRPSVSIDIILLSLTFTSAETTLSWLVEKTIVFVLLNVQISAIFLD